MGKSASVIPIIDMDFPMSSITDSSKKPITSSPKRDIQLEIKKAGSKISPRLYG